MTTNEILTEEQRQKVIDSLFDHLTSSSFAEGCEERIARSLECKSNQELLALAKNHLTWTPE